jgi:hypothetical protein
MIMKRKHYQYKGGLIRYGFLIAPTVKRCFPSTKAEETRFHSIKVIPENISPKGLYLFQRLGMDEAS